MEIVALQDAIATTRSCSAVGMASDDDADGANDTGEVAERCGGTNGDGYGNACDPDLDGDGVINFVDLALLKSVFFTDDADADFDGGGAINFVDLAVMKQLFF